MRTLAVLLKQPSETWKAFNDRLAEACQVMQPNAARCAVVSDQPKVELIDTEDEDAPVRVAVCPLDADDDAAAGQTEARLQRVLAAAAGKPVVTADSDPPLVTMFCWPEVADEPEDDASAAPPTDAATPTPAREPAATTPAPPPEPALPAGGRPPFGFRRREGKLIEHTDEGAIVRTVLAEAGASPDPDRIVGAVVQRHRAWVDAHWHPKRRAEYVLDIVRRADFYRAHLNPATP